MIDAKEIVSLDPVAGSRAPDIAGNGSPKRLAPIALWGATRSVDDTRDAACRQSAMTHAAPEAVAACGAYVTMVRAAINGALRAAV